MNNAYVPVNIVTFREVATAYFSIKTKTTKFIPVTTVRSARLYMHLQLRFSEIQAKQANLPILPTFLAKLKIP